MSDLKGYKSDYLFLLMGDNPLPNYVAAKMLLKEDGHLCVVYTKETEKMCQSLGELLASEGALNISSTRFHPLPIDNPSDAQHIYEVIRSAAREPDVASMGLGLHYTGGTKAMAVHAHRAVREISPERKHDRVLSYLDPNTLCLVIDKEGQPSSSFPAVLRVQPKIEDLLHLHHLTTAQPIKTNSERPDICKSMANNFKCLREWCKSLNPMTGAKKEEEQIPEGLRSTFCNAGSVRELAGLCRMKCGVLCEWIEGKWLEHFTLHALQEISEECGIHETGLDIKVKPKEQISNRVKFQFDVAAMRGYQFFGFSCAVSSNKGDLKLKLFEAFVRAVQMGGDEARVALICGASDRDGGDAGPTAIQTELEESWQARGKVRVFGVEDLPFLSERLKQWFNQQPALPGR